MASALYENILREVDQLTDEERRRLRAELASTSDEERPDLSTILLIMPPIDPASVDAMERAIEEDSST